MICYIISYYGYGYGDDMVTVITIIIMILILIQWCRLSVCCEEIAADLGGPSEGGGGGACFCVCPPAGSTLYCMRSHTPGQMVGATGGGEGVVFNGVMW